MFAYLCVKVLQVSRRTDLQVYEYELQFALNDSKLHHRIQENSCEPKIPQNMDGLMDG